MTAIYERAARRLFAKLPEGAEVTCTFCELAGKNASDCLNAGKKAKVLSGEDGSAYAVPLCEPIVSSADELAELIRFGQANRATEKTGVHDASSRSHAIVRVFVNLGKGQRQLSRAARRKEGVLTLVDLAGSENRIDSAKHDAARRKEGAEINASLMALKAVLRAVASGTQEFVNYRNSKLTQLLKTSFSDPEDRTVVIATVSPSSKDTEHSINTVRHASIMSGAGETTGKGSSHLVAEGEVVEEEELGSINVTALARGAKAAKASAGSFGKPAARRPKPANPTKKAARLERARRRLDEKLLQGLSSGVCRALAIERQRGTENPSQRERLTRRGAAPRQRPSLPKKKKPDAGWKPKPWVGVADDHEPRKRKAKPGGPVKKTRVAKPAHDPEQELRDRLADPNLSKAARFGLEKRLKMMTATRLRAERQEAQRQREALAAKAKPVEAKPVETMSRVTPTWSPSPPTCGTASDEDLPRCDWERGLRTSGDDGGFQF